ncbi:hypothetical protein HY623_01015 [Candidatus Uhrbacteria bacterium]|nr:hypothetical protein [Candidatus Uhrbacteria bacterium]
MLLDYLHSKYHREIEDGWGALEIGNTRKAEEHFKKVLEHEDDPSMALSDLIDAHNGLAATAREHRDFFDAWRLYREAEYLIAKEFSPLPPHLSWSDPRERPVLRTLVGLAHTSFLRNNVETARRYYREVLARDPKDHLGMSRYVAALEAGETFPDTN